MSSRCWVFPGLFLHADMLSLAATANTGGFAWNFGKFTFLIVPLNFFSRVINLSCWNVQYSFWQCCMKLSILLAFSVGMHKPVVKWCNADDFCIKKGYSEVELPLHHELAGSINIQSNEAVSKMVIFLTQQNNPYLRTNMHNVIGK